MSAIGARGDEARSRHGSAWDSPGFLLWRATLAWQREIRAALAPHDVTHVQFVLLASVWWLGETEGAPTQRRVADHAGTDPMMTSQVVRALESRGLLRRDPDPDDARARRLVLSTRGRDVVRAALPDVEAVDARFFARAPDPAALVPPLQALAGVPRSR